MTRRDWQAKGERQWRPYWVEAQPSWPDALRETLRHVAASPSYRHNGTRRKHRDRYSDHLRRALSEGYLAVTPRRGREKLLVLTEAGRALIAKPLAARVAEPFAKRRAGMAEFREANRRF